MLIDTHAHLTWDSFKTDLPQVVQRALNNGIKTVINIGADLESSLKAAELECTSIKCYSTIGIHPEEGSILSTFESIHHSINELEKVYQTNPEKIVAVGECGLDYFMGTQFSPSTPLSLQTKQLQKELYLTQIALAKKLNLPLIIHTRDSWEDIFVPELHNTMGVFHQFTGNAEQAKKILDMGYYLGFTCIITYPKNDHLRQLIKNLPLDRILTETDCPFLPPQSQRGQRNEPANILEVAKTIAEVKCISLNDVAEQTLKNAQNLFHLS